MFYFLLFLSLQARAQKVCAPQPGGASFNMGCTLVDKAEAERMRAEILRSKREASDKATQTKTKLTMTKLTIGVYADRPGYFILTNGSTQDALLMTEDAVSAFDQKLLKSGATTLDCYASGKQQHIGYTIFSVKSCSPSSSNK